METGNSIKIDTTNDGIYIDILAYSDLADKIVRTVSNEIFKFHPESVVFDDIIQITKNDFKSVKQSTMPFRKNNLFFKKIIKPNYILYSEILQIINSNLFSFHDFQNFVEDFKNDMVMTVLIYGSIESEEVERMTRDLRSYLPKTRLMDSTSLTKYSFQSVVGLHRTLDEMITLQIKNDADKEINHAVTNFYQIGLRDYDKSLYMNIIDKCIGNIFYYNLRTVEQLGYIVNSNINTIDAVLVIY
jgi:secreted Zn-dependent insulinase-like peptidase